MASINRRELAIGSAGIGLAAAAASTAWAKQQQGGKKPRGSPPASTAPGWQYGPFDSLRDYVAELDRLGLVLHIDRLDQDAWEATALMYRMMDRFGMQGAPAFLVKEVKIDGRWVKGPLLANQYGPIESECVALGVEPVPGQRVATHHAALKRAEDFLRDGKFSTLPVKEVAKDKAPVKQVVLTGDAIDVGRFAYIQTNPADAGRYVNTGSVFTWDPELGKNFGTYRCQIKGPRRLGVNPEPNQGGWRMLMKMRERGDKSARISIVLGNDPLTWTVSASKLSRGIGNELELVGGIRGRPLEVIKSETNDILVPAHAEMIIEGEIPLDQPMLPEGPFGEMRGYMGRRKEENFWMDISCITHRRDPWVVNQFTGVNRGAAYAISHAYSLKNLQARAPNVTMLHSPNEAPGFTFVSIRKQKPGEALAVGRTVAETGVIAKIVVVVDEDVEILDTGSVMHAIGARWQPGGDGSTSQLLTKVLGHALDPSLADGNITNKFVIDATRQLPQEGGPKVYQVRNRVLLEQMVPEAIARVDAKWDEIVGDWQPASV